MFLESIDFLELLLEGVKAVVMVILVVLIWGSGRRHPELVTRSWRLIEWGFLLLAVSFFCDWSDELINYRGSPTAYFVETWIEEVGVIIGLTMITIGLRGWFAFIGRFLGLPKKH